MEFIDAVSLVSVHTLATVATVPTLAPHRQAAVRISFRRDIVGSHCHGMSCVSAQPAIADIAIASSSAWMKGGKSVLEGCFIGCVARLNETCSAVRYRRVCPMNSEDAGVTGLGERSWRPGRSVLPRQPSAIAVTRGT